VVVLPVLFEGESLDVIELGSIHLFSPLHLTFLERLVATIGVAIKTIQANRRTGELLHQSQGLARELQDQSAELQRTNAELEEKAKLRSAQHQACPPGRLTTSPSRWKKDRLLAVMASWVAQSPGRDCRNPLT
jgi:hypothetical protein